MRRMGFAVVVGVAMVMAGIASVDSAVAEEPCANEERRMEQGAVALALPDCRAYELVSPGSALFQEGDPERSLETGSRAALDGNAITYFTNLPAEEANTSSYFHLSKRGPEGWSVRTVGAQSAPGPILEDRCAQNIYFSPDLTHNIDEEGGGIEEATLYCKRNHEVLDSRESPVQRNVFLHDVTTGSYQLVDINPEGVSPAFSRFHDASDDFSRILFSEAAKLTPDAPAGQAHYLWVDGEVRLFTYLPGGSPAVGSLVEAASGLAPVTGAVSENGRRIFFYSGTGLYLRLNAEMPQSAIVGGQCTEPDLACTIQVDATQGPGPSGGGVFWRAAPDASKVLFTSERKLTPDSIAVTGRADLYEYDLASRQLRDLTTSVANPGEAADVRGVAGVGENLSRIYFVANGVLASGAASGSCRGSSTTAQCNLYLAHQGGVRFIARLSRQDQEAWHETSEALSLPRDRGSRVRANASPNGRFLAFSSMRSLTGYDNHEAGTGKPLPQIFLYDAGENDGAGELSCASCPPSGDPPTPGLDLQLADNYGPNPSAQWRKNAVLDDGSVLFDTFDSLLSRDTNGRRDVYQYEAGQHHLLSTGTFPGDARFYEATPDGTDIFIRTPESLVGSDIDEGNVSLYDARVDGGFPGPPLPPAPCEGESCRGAVAPGPSALLPGSSVFSGPGNRETGKVKKKRCTKAKRARRCRRAKPKPRLSRKRTRPGRDAGRSR